MPRVLSNLFVWSGLQRYKNKLFRNRGGGKRLHPDKILAAGEEGDELHQHGAADVGENGYRGDGDGYGDRGVGDVAADDPSGYRGKEEHVDEIHAEGQPGEAGDEALLTNGTDSSFLIHPYAAEHQEKSEGLHQDVRRAELPGPFDFGGRDKDSRGSFQPEGPAGEGASDKEA